MSVPFLFIIMEKKIIKIFIFLFFINQGYSQKYDYNWILGHNSKIGDTIRGGNNIDFNIKPLKPYYVFRETNMDGYNTSISDENGELQFYTNGCYIANKFDLKIENGDTINPGKTYTNYCKTGGFGYPVNQSSFAIPSQKDKDVYYLIHKNLQLYLTLPYLLSDRLYMTKVDMSANQGKGKVIYKSKIIMKDSLGGGTFVGTKHADGKDWWLITPKYLSNKYYVFRFSDGLIKDTSLQTIGIKETEDGGFACFSPDGSKYARYEPFKQDQLHLMDFDRSTGKLSNFKYIYVSDYLTNAGCGVTFSPNSRYLYVSLAKYVYQFDTYAEDVEASKVLVAEYDGFQAPFATNFHACQLGPDCRIYINSSNDVRYYHYIDKPDLKGTACNVVQHGLKLPTGHGISIPYFPNYRLGTLDNPGFPCDSTLKTNTTSVGFASLFVPTMGISPNPSQGQFRLWLPENWQGERLNIVNTNGQILYSEKLDPSSQEYFINSDLPQGLYLIQVHFQNGMMKTERLVID